MRCAFPGSRRAQELLDGDEDPEGEEDNEARARAHAMWEQAQDRKEMNHLVAAIKNGFKRVGNRGIMGDEDDDGEMQRRRRRNADGEEEDEDEDADGAVVRNPFSAPSCDVSPLLSDHAVLLVLRRTYTTTCAHRGRFTEQIVPLHRRLPAVAALEAADDEDGDDGTGTQRLRARKVVSVPSPRLSVRTARRTARCLRASFTSPASHSTPSGLICVSLRRPWGPSHLTLSPVLHPQLDTAEALALTEALQDATDKDILKAVTKRKADAPQPPPAAAAGAGTQSHCR